MTQWFSLGLGVGSKNAKGNLLEVFYPQPLLSPDAALSKAVASAVDHAGGNQVIELNTAQIDRLTDVAALSPIAQQLKSSKRTAVITILETDAAPASVGEAYLKLHLLSHRLVKPHGQNLTGIFGVLPNVAWTNQGAIDLEELPARQLQARVNGEWLQVNSVDKFPKLTDYVVPKGVRIADTARVRLGAYLGEGTTIMHEGFCNFNAGTEGPGMIEGRISAGVFVAAGSDLGGGCSTMGTLSGGNNVVISIGKECLIGANAGVGIPLGDRCTIEAGLYVTAASKLNVLDDRGQKVGNVKARDLAGKSDLLFRRNSQTGALEVLTNKSAIELNEALHVNN